MILALIGSAGAWAADLDPAAVFAQAAADYDQGRIADAIHAYEDLVADGYVAGALFYNLGNAYFKNGQPGPAILNYRRAQRLAPRNADLAANLRFALESAGALAPEYGIVTRYLRKLRLGEWIGLATAAYWVSALLGCAWFLRPAARRGLQRLLAPALAVLVLAVVGAGDQLQARRYPECVVMAPGQKALFAPIADSTAHFDAPAGSILEMAPQAGAEKNENWVKVRAGAQVGWLPAGACQPVAASR
jgi:tetratricopeptide (TPR) repeat protein